MRLLCERPCGADGFIKGVGGRGRGASRFLRSASGSAWRYCWVVWIWAWPMRSITDLRSEPSASSHEGWACRRSCIRTGKSTPLALTAGSQIRVRKVLREIGVPDVV